MQSLCVDLATAASIVRALYSGPTFSVRLGLWLGRCVGMLSRQPRAYESGAADDSDQIARALQRLADSVAKNRHALADQYTAVRREFIWDSMVVRSSVAAALPSWSPAAAAAAAATAAAATAAKTASVSTSSSAVDGVTPLPADNARLGNMREEMVAHIWEETKVNQR